MNARIIDFHCDVLYKMLYHGAGRFEKEDDFDVTLPRLKQGGVGMQVFAVFLEDSALAGPPKFAQVLRSIDLLRERINTLPGMRLIRWRDDLERWQQQPDQIGSLLSLEGVDALEGDLVNLRTAYELGVRFIGLTWNHANWAVDGTLEERQAGFTALGRSLIRECDRLGLIIDVSHLNRTAFWELLELTERPIFASHSNAAAVLDHPRNLTDQQIRAIIARDGRIGVTFVPHFIHEGDKASIDHLLRHIEHIAALGGERHLMFGSDFDGIDKKVERLEHAGQYTNLLNELHKRYSPDFVERISSANALTFLATHLPEREQ